MKNNQIVFQQTASFPNAVHEKGAVIALSNIATDDERKEWENKYNQYPDVFQAFRVEKIIKFK